MNSHLFDYKRIAEGYAKDRPFLHGHVMEALKEKLNLSGNLENGLDIGCGAGLSTKALRMICSHVTGTDISPEMVQAAAALYNDASYHFVQSKAEEFEAEPESFDIVTAAGVINWIDETKFLPLLHTLLKKNGILLIYDFWITGEMEGIPGYTSWWNEEYLVHFPKPKRKENIWTADDVSPYRFCILERENYKTAYPMNKEQFIRFMLLQSNVIARVEENGCSLDEVREWFSDTLSPIFTGAETKNLIFSGYNWYLQRQ